MLTQYEVDQEVEIDLDGIPDDCRSCTRGIVSHISVSDFGTPQEKVTIGVRLYGYYLVTGVNDRHNFKFIQVNAKSSCIRPV